MRSRHSYGGVFQVDVFQWLLFTVDLSFRGVFQVEGVLKNSTTLETTPFQLIQKLVIL
jgi:hypothetical protein